MRLHALFATLAVSIAGGNAAAAPGSLGSACQMDFQLFCPSLDPESARADVAACLLEHKDTLTEECRAALDPASVPRAPRDAGLGGACREDFGRFCGHEADRMAFARCVQSHRRDLSPACRDAMDAQGGAGGPGASPGGRPSRQP